MAQNEKVKLKWLSSYETIKFDSLDGDLGKDEYAKHPLRSDTWFVRKHPKNNFQFLVTKDSADILGKMEIQIADPRGSYYDEFELPDKRTLRIPSTRKEYWDRGELPDAPQPVKEVDDLEIAEIIKDDDLWQ